jgi:hypothetical protein
MLSTRSFKAQNVYQLSQSAEAVNRMEIIQGIVLSPPPSLFISFSLSLSLSRCEKTPVAFFTKSLFNSLPTWIIIQSLLLMRERDGLDAIF